MNHPPSMRTSARLALLGSAAASSARGGWQASVMTAAFDGEVADL